jgi:cytochrome c biogenesis protein CcmG/thiol:disulfide interchange protein DsbE
VTEPTVPRRRGVGFWIGAGAGAVVVILLVLVFAGSFGNDPRQPENIPLEGAELADMELPLLDGSGTLAFDDLRGRPLVINFFASFCIPCRAEHAELTAVSEMYRADGVQFVGIVYQDTTEAATAFLDELGWGDGYLYVQDPGSRAIVEFGVFGVPETYVVDAEGIIRAKFYGAVDRNDLIPALDDILDRAS